MTRASLRILALLAAASLAVAGCGSSTSTRGDTPESAPATSTGRGTSRATAVPDPGGPAISGARRHIIYLSEFRIGTILERLLPTGPGPLEKAQVYRQVPANQTILPPTYRIARINGQAMSALTATEMAREMRRAIDGTCTTRMPCRSHLVSIDDVGTEFQRKGGQRLAKAMEMLDRPSPWGSTYARRVVMYVPIHMINGLQAGGAEARSWAPAVRAVAAAESYWLEMYPDWIHDANYATWTHGTRAFVKAIERAGGEVGRTHFILGAATGRIDGMPREMCPNGRGCAWKATRATVLNRQISDNGVGLYRVGPTALQVLCVATVEERESLDRATWGIVMRACGRWLRTGEREALRKRAGSMK